MKILFFITAIFIGSNYCSAQTVTLYTNNKLTTQVSANYAYRMANESIYQNRVDGILEKTENIRNQYAKFVIVKEHVYESLVNVNSALVQSKQVMMFGTYIANISNATSEAISIASQHPELLPFCNNAVTYIVGNSTEIYSLLNDFVLNTNREQLMDYRERQKIVDQLRSRLIILQGSAYNLVNVLKYRSRLSLMDNILRDFAPQETILVNQIMGNYNRIVF